MVGAQVISVFIELSHEWQSCSGSGTSSKVRVVGMGE